MNAAKPSAGSVGREHVDHRRALVREVVVEPVEQRVVEEPLGEHRRDRRPGGQALGPLLCRHPHIVVHTGDEPPLHRLGGA